jgi:hypothetical protein
LEDLVKESIEEAKVGSISAKNTPKAGGRSLRKPRASKSPRPNKSPAPRGRSLSSQGESNEEDKVVEMAPMKMAPAIKAIHARKSSVMLGNKPVLLDPTEEVMFSLSTKSSEVRDFLLKEAERNKKSNENTTRLPGIPGVISAPTPKYDYYAVSKQHNALRKKHSVLSGAIQKKHDRIVKNQKISRMQHAERGLYGGFSGSVGGGGSFYDDDSATQVSAITAGGSSMRGYLREHRHAP